MPARGAAGGMETIWISFWRRWFVTSDFIFSSSGAMTAIFPDLRLLQLQILRVYVPVYLQPDSNALVSRNPIN